MSGDDHSTPLNDPVPTGARAAARRLAAEIDPGLEVDVEAALHTRGLAPQPRQYFDPISLGTLIVSVATLAWTVYTDLRTRTPQPSAETVARTIRVQLRDADAMAPEQQARVVEVVVDEVLHAALAHE
jgi:hypothetical protein